MTTSGNYNRPATPEWAGTGVTDASGNAVIAIPAGRFAAAPIVSMDIQRATGNMLDFRATAITATSITVNVQQSPVLSVVGIDVLGARIPAGGVTVHVLARAAG